MLPARRFPDIRARYPIRQLRAPQGVGPDVPREIHVRHELAGRTARARCHQPDSLAVVLPHQAHRLGNVAVIAHDDRAVVGVEPAVVEQMHRKVDVRALLLGSDHLRRARGARTL